MIEETITETDSRAALSATEEIDARIEELAVIFTEDIIARLPWYTFDKALEMVRKLLNLRGVEDYRANDNVLDEFLSPEWPENVPVNELDGPLYNTLLELHDDENELKKRFPRCDPSVARRCEAYKHLVIYSATRWMNPKLRRGRQEKKV